MLSFCLLTLSQLEGSATFASTRMCCLKFKIYAHEMQTNFICARLKLKWLGTQTLVNEVELYYKSRGSSNQVVLYIPGVLQGTAMSDFTPDLNGMNYFCIT